MASNGLKTLDATKERIMVQFQSTRRAQQFLPAYDWISNLFVRAAETSSLTPRHAQAFHSRAERA
jgi:hypothetical protein